MSINKEELKKQIEYYLSNQNLSQDEFFHDQILKSEEGYLPLNLILKCNKIKKLGVSQESQMVDAIKDSQLLELNETNTSLRRKGNPKLPELNVQKKVKLNNSEAADGTVIVQEKVENPFENFDPLIFTLKAPEGIQVTWGQINEALMKQYNITCPYVRYGKTEGNFALNKKRTTQETLDKLKTEGIKIGENIVQVTETEGTILAEFWAHHGKHYEGIIKRAKEQFSGKPQKEQKKLGKFGKKQKEIVFHNQKYKDINQLKNIFKTILARSENGAPLKEPYNSMLLELLQYHDKKDKKVTNFKHFSVGTHPDHPETRCFMIVKTDGSQEDFSCIKCIQNLQKEIEGEE